VHAQVGGGRDTSDEGEESAESVENQREDGVDGHRLFDRHKSEVEERQHAEYSREHVVVDNGRATADGEHITDERHTEEDPEELRSESVSPCCCNSRGDSMRYERIIAYLESSEADTHDVHVGGERGVGVVVCRILLGRRIDCSESRSRARWCDESVVWLKQKQLRASERLAAPYDGQLLASSYVITECAVRCRQVGKVCFAIRMTTPPKPAVFGKLRCGSALCAVRASAQFWTPAHIIFEKSYVFTFHVTPPAPAQAGASVLASRLSTPNLAGLSWFCIPPVAQLPSATGQCSIAIRNVVATTNDVLSCVQRWLSCGLQDISHSNHGCQNHHALRARRSGLMTPTMRARAADPSRTGPGSKARSSYRDAHRGRHLLYSIAP
jgi:hypothetical protein